MSRYQDSSGRETTANDPERLVWYGWCTYWTDDWEKMGKTPTGIPCCPCCGQVGFQQTAKSFLGDARSREFAESYKENCYQGEAKEAHRQRVMQFRGTGK